jgi:hypothetical protein
MAAPSGFSKDAADTEMHSIPAPLGVRVSDDEFNQVHWNRNRLNDAV